MSEEIHVCVDHWKVTLHDLQDGSVALVSAALTQDNKMLYARRDVLVLGDSVELPRFITLT